MKNFSDYLEMVTEAKTSNFKGVLEIEDIKTFLNNFKGKGNVQIKSKEFQEKLATENNKFLKKLFNIDGIGLKSLSIVNSKLTTVQDVLDRFDKMPSFTEISFNGTNQENIKFSRNGQLDHKIVSASHGSPDAGGGYQSDYVRNRDRQ